MGVDDNFKKKNTKTYHTIIHEICGLTYKNSKPVLEVTETDRINAAYIREKHGLQNYGEFILVNLGGGNRWQYKKWTKEGYSDLINKLSAKKPNSALGAVTGDEDKDFYHDAVKSIDKRDNVFLFGCENSIEDFIGMIYLADKVFTSDSLAFHIATALEKYTVVFTGPTSYTELDVFERKFTQL
jgi:heptosyltransferase-2